MKQSSAPLKKCECSDECVVMIPNITKQGNPRKYADGHFYRSYKNPHYRGGLKQSTSDYPMLFMPWHPNAEKSGYIYTHIWVMSRKIKRPLEKGEVVHHIDGNKENNHPDNLQLFSSHSEHMSETTGKDKSGRFCKQCGSKTTYTYDGYESWYEDGDGYLCNKCYRKKNYKYIKKKK